MNQPTTPPLAAETAAEVLARWEAEERAVREKLSPHVASMRPDQVAGRSAMELFAAMFAGDLPAPPIGHTLDFVPIHIEPGHAVFQGRPSPRHYNPMGSVHGGWYATLLDSAVACAVHACMPAGRAYTTLELKLNIVRSLPHQVPLVRAEGRAIHVGAQTATAEGRLVGPDGRLYAHATTTCLVFDYPPKGRSSPR